MRRFSRDAFTLLSAVFLAAAVVMGALWVRAYETPGQRVEDSFVVGDYEVWLVSNGRTGQVHIMGQRRARGLLIRGVYWVVVPALAALGVGAGVASYTRRNPHPPDHAFEVGPARST